MTSAPRGSPQRLEGPESTRRSVIRELPPKAPTDAELVVRLRTNEHAAAALLFDRYSGHVERLLWGVLGPESEAEDLLQEVFFRALSKIHDIDDPARLKGWLTGITVYTAREWIRRKSRRRWLRFVEHLPEAPQPFASEEVTEATRAAYGILAQMSEEERIPFCLRFVEGMDVAEIAAACDLSVSTTKRRLKSAEIHFVKRARCCAAVLPFLEAGRWGKP